VQKGLLLKLVTDYSNVPAGTWATVDSTVTMKDGAWWFTVRWHHYRPIPRAFPRAVSEYSINLWEPDLALFEAVCAEEEHAVRALDIETRRLSIVLRVPKLGGRWPSRMLNRKVSVHPNQLRLFLPNDLE
jgi:hypothetical protein